MSWLDEARQLVAQKQNSSPEVFDPSDDDQRANLIKKLKTLYDNATEREIEKALDNALDRFRPPYEEKEFMKFLRTKLED